MPHTPVASGCTFADDDTRILPATAVLHSGQPLYSSNKQKEMTGRNRPSSEGATRSTPGLCRGAGLLQAAPLPGDDDVRIPEKLYYIRRGGRVATLSGPVSVEIFTARTVDAFIRMCAEIITLRL